MASRYTSITEMAKKTIAEVTASPKKWAGYLKAAGRHYKSTYREQILIYAQRPHATACAPIEYWNTRLHRWVNRGARGIALIDEHSHSPRLRYVFDISDTHPAREDIPPPYLWQLREAFEPEVMEHLTAVFGEVNAEHVDFAHQIHAVCLNAAQDNADDYIDDFMSVRAGSSAERLDDTRAAAYFFNTVAASVTWCVMMRCGLEPDAYLGLEPFSHVPLFNTYEAAVQLGTATSEISEMILREVERSVKGIEKQKLFDLRGVFANNARTSYDNGKERHTERSSKHGSDLQTGGRLRAAEPDADRERAEHGGVRQVRHAPENVSDAAPTRDIQRPDVAKQAARPSGRGRPNSAGSGRPDGAGDDAGRRRERAAQSREPDGLDGQSERDPSASGGNGAAQLHLQVNTEKGATELASAAPFSRSEDTEPTLPTIEAQAQALAAVGALSDAFDASEQMTLEALTAEHNAASPHVFSQSVTPPPEQPAEEEKGRALPKAPPPRNFRITDDHLGAGGAKAKYTANIAAIREARTVMEAGGAATPEQQEIISRYVGWGSLPQAFDPRNEKWTKEYVALKELLTDEEYQSARASTLNAHYTSPTVIKAIYACAEKMGFQTGNILEPAMGVGNFFGLLPDSMAASKLYGVELDSVTGQLATLLYPQANIQIKGFEKTTWPDNFFDFAVGNVPFGSYKVSDPKYDKLNFTIHNFFFAKTVDQLRPGGVIAFVTSRYTMDSRDSTVRRYLAQRCDLLGAIRLPNTAFKENAGTEVTSDILFLQKRDRIAEREPEWVQVGKTAENFVINSYFVEHPEMVLGTLSQDDRMYGSEQDITCQPDPDADLADLLADAVQNIHAEIPVFVRDEEEQEENEDIPADPNVRNFSFTEVNGRLYYRENSVMHPVDTSKTGASRVRGMLEIRDAVRALIDAQMDSCTDEVLHTLQGKLGAAYDQFTAKYDRLCSRGNSMAFSDDSGYPLLCALELYDDEGKFARKADMFTRRTIRQTTNITHVDTPEEALGVCIGDRACVDLGYMSTLLGRPGDVEPVIEALRGMIYENPANGRWETADEYLSGNVREKLEAAQRAAANSPKRFVENVAALTEVQPRPLEAAEIDVRLGARWIPTEDYRSFLLETLGTPFRYHEKIRVLYSSASDIYNVTGKSEDKSDNVKANVTFGTQRVSAYELMQTSLNSGQARIFDMVMENGNEVRKLNHRETMLAQQKQQSLKNAFRDWIWRDPARRERLTAMYNERFNSTRPREYDGSHIRFVGMNPEIKLQKHQIDAVARVLYGGNALLAHCVGAGKTWEMAAAAMECKRLGLCQKSIFVVPGHLTEQWGGEFLQLYPSANILVATKKDFETANRRKFCGRIATGDYDAIIIGHSQFEKIPVSLERQQAQLERQIGEIQMSIGIAKAEKGEQFTIKQMEYTRKTLEEKLKRLISTERKDSVVTYEELGVDRLFVDEADTYKNLFLYTKMRNVAGIGQAEAQKSADLYMKCLYMDELTGARGNIFGTGTPISNSMTVRP